jgi:hypothetical protein
MGADLYINKLRRPVQAEWQPKFDAAVAQRDSAQDAAGKDAGQKLVDEAYEKLFGGDHYFRDSYNGTSILARLGLSWWRDLQPDVEYVEGDPATEINVSAEACRKLRDQIAAAEYKPVTFDSLKAEHCTVDYRENSPARWNQFFSEKRDRLIAFLDRAIEHGGMYASC